MDELTPLAQASVRKVASKHPYKGLDQKQNGANVFVTCPRFDSEKILKCLEKNGNEAGGYKLIKPRKVARGPGNVTTNMGQPPNTKNSHPALRQGSPICDIIDLTQDEEEDEETVFQKVFSIKHGQEEERDKWMIVDSMKEALTLEASPAVKEMEEEGGKLVIVNSVEETKEASAETGEEGGKLVIVNSVEETKETSAETGEEGSKLVIVDSVEETKETSAETGEEGSELVIVDSVEETKETSAETGEEGGKLVIVDSVEETKETSAETGEEGGKLVIVDSVEETKETSAETGEEGGELVIVDFRNFSRNRRGRERIGD